MHKGIILLVSANDRDEAKEKAEEFLAHHGDGKVWDWYVIGGRWSGTLTGWDTDKDPRNYKPCECKGKDKTCNRCNGTGKERNFGNVDIPDDAMPCTKKKVLSVIKDWSKSWRENLEKECHKGLAQYAGEKKSEFSMRDYYQRKLDGIEGDEFTFDSNVYDTERNTNTPPSSFKGYWAVMCDLHN